MKLTTTIAQTVVRTLGLIQIGLGVLFWTYNVLNLIPLHMLIGLVVVLALWALAGLGLRTRVHPGLASAAFAWGVLVIALGMTQMRILPGDLHWIVQVLHLGFGLAAMAFAEVLGHRVRAALGGNQLARPVAATT
jgi:hypothetical protein